MRIFPLALILSLAIFVGCSSSSLNQNQPLTPGMEINGNMSVGVSERFPDGTPSAGYGVMGLYTLHIDKDKVTAELSTARKSALTDTLEVVDITNFLQLAPCTDCAKIKSVALNDDGLIVVNIGIKHPFPVGDPFKPITGRNRGDLHVFNVEGVVATQSSSSTNFPSFGKRVCDVKLVNASGYTPYLDSVLDEFFTTEANIHPYILHFADYGAGNFNPLNSMGFESVTTPPPSGNLVMAMGCDYDYRDYVFDLDSSMTYTYAVGCTYAVSSANKSMRFSPEYRVPQHLKKAASEVIVIPPTEKLKQNDPSASITLQVQVVDISHGVAVGSALNEMLADSSVSTVSVEIPGVLTGGMSQPGSNAVSGTGHDPSDPLLYEFTFANQASAPIGFYTGLVKVLDSYPAGLNTSPLLNAKDGIKRVDPLLNPLTGVFDINEFATYATFTVEVELGYVGSDPVAALKRGYSGCAPATVTLDASDSYDADDTFDELLFEFDYFYDGVTFTVDRPQSHDPIATNTYSTPGCYTAAVRVTDTDLNQVIATVVVPVGHFTPAGSDSEITDGSTITNIDFIHGAPTFVSDVNWPGTTNPAKGSARGDGYIYTVFYATSGSSRGIFFARSNDDGDAWSTPVMVHEYTGSGEYSGCSIAADNSGQVLIVWSDRYNRDLGLEYSLDNGATFSSKLIRDESICGSWCTSYRMPDVAIDPTNSNNIIIASMYWYWGTSWFGDVSHLLITYSSAGPEGSFDQVFYAQNTELHPGYTVNVYRMHAHYAIDGDAYVMLGENNTNIIYRSSDSGASWSADAEHKYIHEFGGWHRDFDSAMDPTNPDVFFITRVERSPWSPYYPIKLVKSTDGLTCGFIQNNVNDNTSSGVRRFCPSVTVNDAGVVYVMWHTNQSGNYEIMADYSCNNGALFTTDIVFNTVNSGNEVDVDLIPNACGDGVVCIWEQNGDNPAGKLVSRRG